MQGEFDSDVFQKENTPDVVKKPPVQPVIIEPDQKMETVPTQQKRMMFAQQRQLEKEKSLERDAALRRRAEMVPHFVSSMYSLLSISENSKPNCE